MAQLAIETHELVKTYGPKGLPGQVWTDAGAIVADGTVADRAAAQMRADVAVSSISSCANTTAPLREYGAKLPAAFFVPIG
ncbi:hypothetical protein LCGC14_1532940 [marine sediment metagenome]|uniref:Uncharacterized protein n=1 Tax=marine sediment metagenome TaxID=412755 RepID=A0A0F9LB97_9ZZZZ